MSTKSEIETTPPVSSDALVLPFFRVIVTKLRDGERWKIVSNPRWDHCTRAQNAILQNEANDYAEHSNCGCVYRMIRAKNLREYVDGRSFKPEWALDPRQNVHVDARIPAPSKSESITD
jgi:hypothetical protein